MAPEGGRSRKDRDAAKSLEAAPEVSSLYRHRSVRAGFIPLIDCAILAVAKEKGFAKAEKIDLQLVKEVSWANIRDRITLRHFDCAHILAGIPIASGLDLGNAKAPMFAPFSLGLNGNAITISPGLWERMREAGGLTVDDGPLAKAEALAKVVARDKAEGRPPLTFGMVYPFSAHNYELRYWLAAAGIHPDRDVRLTVVPPPYMVDFLKDSHIDGFCVGEPWNSLAVEEGVGRILLTKAELWRLSPEKVLGVRADWADENPEILDALLRALKKAAAWADAPEHHKELAEILAQPAYIGAPAPLIERILSGNVRFEPDQAPRQVDNYIVFDRHDATFPWKSHALWFYSQMVRWGQIEASPEHAAAAAGSYRPDIYRRALVGKTLAIPPDDLKIEGAPVPEAQSGFFDDRIFDPSRLDAYIADFDLHA